MFLASNMACYRTMGAVHGQLSKKLARMPAFGMLCKVSPLIQSFCIYFERVKVSFGGRCKGSHLLFEDQEDISGIPSLCMKGAPTWC